MNNPTIGDIVLLHASEMPIGTARMMEKLGLKDTDDYGVINMYLGALNIIRKLHSEINELEDKGDVMLLQNKIRDMKI